MWLCRERKNSARNWKCIGVKCTLREWESAKRRDVGKNRWSKINFSFIWRLCANTMDFNSWSIHADSWIWLCAMPLGIVLCVCVCAVLLLFGCRLGVFCFSSHIDIHWKLLCVITWFRKVIDLHIKNDYDDGDSHFNPLPPTHTERYKVDGLRK